MKSKLVKYPFSEKKYRWDTWEQGKEFEYYWDESLPNNFTRLDPFIVHKQVNNNGNRVFGMMNVGLDPNTHMGDLYELGNYYTPTDYPQVQTQPQKVKSNYFISEKYNLSSIFENYYQLRYGHSASKIYPQRANPVGDSTDYINTFAFGIIYFVYTETNNEIVLDLVSADNENEGWALPHAFDWINKTNTVYDLSSATDLQTVADLIKQEYGFTKTTRWRSTYSNDALYIVAFNYEKNKLPYTYPESHYNWNRHTRQYGIDTTTGEILSSGGVNWVFLELDTYYIVKDNANLTNYNFNFLSFVKNVSTSNSQIYNRGNRKGTTPYLRIERGGNSHLKLSPNFFDYIYNNPSAKNDKWAINTLMNSTNRNYFYMLLEVTFGNYGVSTPCEDAFVAINGNNLQFDFELKRLVDENNNKYMAIYNKANTFLDSYDSVWMSGSFADNINYNDYLPLIPIYTETKTDTPDYSPSAYVLRDNYTFTLTDIGYDDRTYNHTVINVNWENEAVNWTQRYYHYNNDPTNYTNAYLTKLSRRKYYPLRCFTEESGSVMGQFLRFEANKSNIPSNSYQEFVIQNWYELEATSALELAGDNWVAVDLSEWMTIMGNERYNYQFYEPDTTLEPKVWVAKPEVIMINDKGNTSVVYSGDATTFKYTLGEVVNNEFVAKQIATNVPCEYSNGTVSSRTWLSFNQYTANEWATGYHFEGKQWNSIVSPFAYLNNIKSSTGDRTMVFSFEELPQGFYQRITFDGDYEVSDSLGNDYITQSDAYADKLAYWDDNVGSLWYFGSGTVNSTDRNAYPDAGSQGGYTYRLRPQDTTFIRYFRERETLANVELFSDRYKYSHTPVDYCDRSYEGTVCGTSSSTGENTIPDGTWREYLGLYLGESIPFLGIVETEISPSNILGVPVYDKQVNTSDTLKYGTIGSASVSFNLNMPVEQAMAYNGELLILYYDFKHNNDWRRMGFFYIDKIEALDEYSTALVAHDEARKLNYYVDDFLENYTQEDTLNNFYHNLLSYCGCFYDAQEPAINNGSLMLNSIYHAVKTTGVQVAHYIAILAPGYIHADIDGDIRLERYNNTNIFVDIHDYSNLVYTAYNTDKLNKIKITENNNIIGEDSGTGQNVYYLADDPLISYLLSAATLNGLANDILAKYNEVPNYRPATIHFLVLPQIKIGDIIDIETPTEQQYKVIVMGLHIDSSGAEIKSFGTQAYPVEQESNSQFVNLINEVGSVTGDVTNLQRATEALAAVVGNNTVDIDNLEASDTIQNSTLGTHTTQIGNLQTLTNGYGVSSSGNLGTVTLNGTLDNLVQKAYLDNKFSTSTSNNLANLTINGSVVSNLATKNYVNGAISGLLTIRFGTLRFGASYGGGTISCNVFYIGNSAKTYGLLIPPDDVVDNSGTATIKYYKMFSIYNGTIKGLSETGTNSSVLWNDLQNPSLTLS